MPHSPRLLEWRAEFELGIPAIDHEHREMFDLINEVYADIQGPDAGANVGDFLGEIYAQIIAHFALEESAMRAARYDEYDTHKAEHDRLLDDIRDHMDAFDDGRIADLDELSERLEHWFVEHFRTQDARLHLQLTLPP